MRFVKFIGRVLILFIGVFLFSELIIAQKPGWVLPNPALYSFNTSVTAVIRFDRQISASLEDTIAFFVGSQIRGISIPTKIGNDIRHYGTVYSSLTAEPISIKIYHALSNKVYEVKDSLPFVAQVPIGDYENPYEVTLFSSGDAPISIDSIEEKFTLENIPFDTIDLQLILNQPDDDSVSWSVTPHPDFLTVITENKLVISPRAGFIGSGLIEIKAVEQTINANYAIQQIKLNVLKVPVRPAWDSIPGQGIIKGNVFKTFSLPDFENKYQGDCLSFEYIPILPKTNQPDTMPVWNVQQTFLNSMTFIAKSIYTPILPFNHPNDRLAAFIDGELRGVAEPQVINGQVLYFLGVGSQQSVGLISFHFYSGALKRLFISPLKTPYIASAVRGSVEIPFEINLSPLQPVIDSNNLVQLQIVDTSWVGKMDFQFIARDCGMPKLSSASQSLLASSTFVTFCVTNNNADLFTFYKDEDGDGFGNPALSQTICEANIPPNYVTNKLDCDDKDDAIKPFPTVSKIQDFTFCNGILSDTITLKRGTNGLNSLSSKTVYKWINNNTSIGLGASGSGNIAPFLTANAKNVADSARIIVTPELNGCIGVSDTFLLFVKTEKLLTYYKDEDGDGFGNASDSIKICEANIPPKYVSNKLDCDDKDDAIKPYPTVSKIQDFTLCNGILSDTIALKRGATGINSLSSNTIFKWTNNNTSIGLGVSGSGTIAPFLTANAKNVADSARIIVTPELNGCIGVSDTFLLYVKAEKLITYYKDEDGDGFGNAVDSIKICEAIIPPNYVTNKLDCDDKDDAIKPFPTVSKIQDYTFCNGILSDTITLKRGTNGLNSLSSNTIFKWTNNNTSIGLSASGSGTIAPFLTANAKNVADSARIIVTPELNGCIGVSDTFLLFIKAEKLVTYYKDVDGDGFGDATDSLTICEANIPPNYVSNKLDCDDSDDAIKPFPTVSKIQDYTFCNGILSDTITLKRGTNGLNSLSSNTIFKWTNNNTSIGLSASGSGTIAPFLTANAKNVADSARIIVTPELNGCIGVSDTFLLYVKAEKLITYYKDEDGDGFGDATDSLTICEANIPPNYVSNKLDCDDSDDAIKPFPRVEKVQDFTFCSGIKTDTIFLKQANEGINSKAGNIIFKWTNNNSAVGLVASGSGNIVPFFSSNTKNIQDSARIIVTPEINGCPGIKDTFLLIVKPDTISRVGSLNCSAYTSSSLVLPNANDLYQNTLRIPYTGGNGLQFDSMIIKSEGVSGLTMKLKQGILIKGDGFLEFDISGIPLQEGIAKFSIDFGRADCDFRQPCEITFNVSLEKPKVDSILCSKSFYLPNKIYSKVPYRGKLDLPYLGGNQKLEPSRLFTSEGIRGLNARFNSDTLKRNGGILSFNLDGLPEQLGTSSIFIDIGGKSCVVNLLVENLPVTMPKFFSPNGDGKNERWEIPYFNILYPQGTVIILDRNGRKLLEYNGNFDGWDGNINGYSASTGVYWYVVQLDKGSNPLRGNFTLIR